MQLFTYNFTNFFDFSSPSMEMWLAPHELYQFASVIAREMLSAVPDLAHKGMCCHLQWGWHGCLNGTSRHSALMPRYHFDRSGRPHDR
jgi:hypothetical protein